MSRPLPAAWIVLTMIVALFVAALPARADRIADLVTVENAYRKALAAEKTAKEAVDGADAAVETARSAARAAAQAQNARWDRLQANIEKANGEALGLLEERARLQVATSQAADRSREARRIYDEARPIYEIRARSELLADNPEWRAIEKRASETYAAAIRIAREDQPKLDDVDRGIAAKQEELRRLRDATAEAAALAPADPTGRWLRAALEAATARRRHGEAQAGLARAFDAYVARLGTVRPPFLEAVSANVGNRPLYDGVWRRDRVVEDPNEQRRRDIRAALDDLDPTIFERETEREALRVERLQIAERLHPISLAIVRAEERAADANFNKILYTALAEAGGTVVEAAVTGGVSVAIRAAEQAAEKAVERVAARRLVQAERAFEPEAAAIMRRMVQGGERALAADGSKLVKELEDLAVEAAARRVQRTGEALDAATIDAKRRVAQAIRSLQSTDPLVRFEAMRQAEAIFGTKVKEFVTAVGLAAESKFASAAASDALIGGGSTTQDVNTVVAGDVIEQAIARGTSYALSVAPEAIGAARTAAAANASRWRQVKDGTVAFVKAGRSLEKFKEAVGGTARGNLVTIVTTALKVAITKHFADQQYLWEAHAANMHLEWHIGYVMLRELMDADREIAGPLAEARRLQAELRTYLALVEGPRKLETTDGETEVAADGTIELTLRFSTEIAAPPLLTFAGVALKPEPAGGAPTAAAVWKVVVARRALPADARTAQLVVALPDSPAPPAPLDSDPATPARPDPRAPIKVEGGRAVVAWLGMESGADRHHTIALRDPWTGLWARGESRIRIDRDGIVLTGKLEKAGEPGHTERGFTEGSVVLRGIVGPHRQGQFQMLARYDREWRQRCPAVTIEYWAEGDYVLDPSGRLSGDWPDRQFDEACKLAESVRQKDELTRVPPTR